jgi:hypothetical protein
MKAKVLWVSLLLIFFAGKTFAQTFTLLGSQMIPKPVAVSQDRYGQVSVAFESGTVSLFDSTGKKLYEYSPFRPVEVNLLESWRTVKIFAFYKDLQAYSLFNRFLVATAEQYRFPASFGFIRTATLANDDNLWLFDEVDFSLKKYNPETQTLLLDAPMSLILDGKNYNLGFMREYQNLLFISEHNSGILVFDNLGNYRKKLPFPGVTYFSFLEDELYFLQQNELYFFNLYTLAERRLKLPGIPEKIQFTILTGNRLFLLTEKQMYVYKAP